MLIWSERKEEENKDMITIPILKYWEIKFSFPSKIKATPSFPQPKYSSSHYVYKRT